MSRLIQPLLFMFARCTKNELIRQIEFLKAENELLRRRVPKKRIILKPAERERLIELGKGLGHKLKDLLTVVAYSTFRGWLKKVQHVESRQIKQGRPRTPQEIRELIIRIRTETGWGYTRIMGEMKKLGLKPPSRSTVKNILREHGFDPRPERRTETWNTFLERHAKTLWQCDFFSKSIWTWKGRKQFFALAFLHLDTRRVFVTPSTMNPNGAWLKKQTEAFIEYAKEQGIDPGIVTRDGDFIFQHGFDATLKSAGFKPKRIVYRSPNLNAYVERWVQSIQQECLDHFLVFGEQHFNHLISEYVEHYHTERPHQALGNVPLTGDWPDPEHDMPPDDGIECRSRLGGWLKTYVRMAA